MRMLIFHINSNAVMKYYHVSLIWMFRDIIPMIINSSGIHPELFILYIN